MSGLRPPLSFAMKLGPAGFLILTMFGSFAVIIAAMIVLFRPDTGTPGSGAVPSRTQRRQALSGPEQTPVSAKPAAPRRSESTSPRPAAPDTAGPGARSADRVGRTQAEPPRDPAPPVQSVWPPPRQQPAPHGKVYWKLQRERKEMALLKAEMRKRLKEQLADRERKLARLARECEQLKPGESAQILQQLDDESLSQVLERMEAQKALKVAALLKRLGREVAASIR